MTALEALAAWMDEQLGDEHADRQRSAEQALIRLWEIAASHAAETAATPVTTSVMADGSAVLSPADLVQVLGALEAAAALLDERASQYCYQCSESLDGLCESHAADVSAAAVYRAVSARLGGAQ